MYKKYGFLSFLLIIFLNFYSTAQNSKLSLKDGTIDNQFEFIIQRSTNYQEYKVVRLDWLNTLRSSILDSIKMYQDKSAEVNTTLNSQNLQVKTLKDSLASTHKQLDVVLSEKSTIDLFGISLSKTVYNAIMWTSICLLLLLLITYIYKYKNSNTVTVKAKEKLKDVEVEFEEHRKRALEREQLVRRQLQDEINKQKQKKG